MEGCSQNKPNTLHSHISFDSVSIYASVEACRYVKVCIPLFIHNCQTFDFDTVSFFWRKLIMYPPRIVLKVGEHVQSQIQLDTGLPWPAVTRFYGSWERLTPRSFCSTLGLGYQRENTLSSSVYFHRSNQGSVENVSSFRETFSVSASNSAMNSSGTRMSSFQTVWIRIAIHAMQKVKCHPLQKHIINSITTTNC